MKDLEKTIDKIVKEAIAKALDGTIINDEVYDCLRAEYGDNIVNVVYEEKIDNLVKEKYKEIKKSFGIEEKPKEEAEQKYFCFEGSWYWGCYAESLEEAQEKFEEAYTDDYSFSDDYTIEEVEAIEVS